MIQRRRSSSDAPYIVSPETFRRWVAKRLDGYLRGHPHLTIQALADQVGVSSATISRWRDGSSNIADDHYDRLFSALEITRNDLAEDLNMPEVTLPTVRTRGAARTRGGGHLLGGASSPRRNSRDAGQPARIYALLARSQWPEGSKWLEEALATEQSQLSQSLQAPRSATEFKLGENNIVMTPDAPSKALLLELLNDISLAAQPTEMALTVLSVLVERHAGELQICLGSNDRVPLARVLKQIAQSTPTSVVFLEARWPEDDGMFPGAQVEREMLTWVLPDVLVLAALPQRKSHLKSWRFLGSHLLNACDSGWTDSGKERRHVSVGDFWNHLASTLQPQNDKALIEKASGRTATVIPIPRLIMKRDTNERIRLAHRPGR